MHSPPRSPKKDQIWQKPFIERRRAELGGEIEKRLASPEAEPTLHALWKEAQAIQKRDDYASQLDAYLLTVETIMRSFELPPLPHPELAKPLAFAERILDRQGVSPERSRLAYLRAELSLLGTELAARNGENWRAAWHQVHALGGADRSDPRLLCLLGQRYLRLGDVSEAIQAYIEAEERSTHPTDFLRARLSHARALRLKGSRDSAKHLIAATEIPPLAKADHDEAFRWELAKHAALDSNDLLALAAVARETADPISRAEAWLWAAVLPVRNGIRRMPPFRTALRMHLDSLPSPSSQRPFGEAVLCLVKGYEPQVPIHERVRRIGSVLGEVERVSEVEQELLIWAAATRWLIRFKQTELIPLTLSKYQGLSLVLSAGERRDVLGLFPDQLGIPETIPLEPWDAYRYRFQIRLRTLPTRQIQRLSDFGKMALACLGATGRHYMKRSLRRTIEKGAPEGDLAIAICEIASGYLGRMRGPAMKLGQVLGSLGFDLPSEARESLRDLCDFSPELNSKVLERAIEEDFGKPPQALFHRFSSRPIASGSMGQVHRATTREGDEVVVKVLYPQIRTIVENDLRLFRLLAPLVKQVLPHWDFDGIVSEVRTKMLEECDYTNEAKSQSSFHRIYRDDPGIVIPGVFERYCSPRVLTSSFIPGISLKSFSERASEAQRNRAAETMFRWHYECILSHRHFNTDPHRGNYLFLNDKVAFIDFGNVKQWRSPQSEGLVEIMAALVLADKSRFMEGMRLAEMVLPQSDVDLEIHYQRTAGGILRALAWDKEIPIESAIVSEDVRANLIDNPDVYGGLSIHRENSFLFKTHWGFYATLSLLKPRSNWHRIVRPLIGNPRVSHLS